MGKRFTDTEKWTGRPWFRKLTPEGKLLWLYMLDTCDLAGVIQLDLELAAFVIGADVTDATLKELSKQLVAIDGDKLWLRDFIDFQYGELKETCRPHTAVIRVLKGYRKGINTLFKEYSKGYKTKTRIKTKKGEGNGEGGATDIESIYQAYPKHVGKDAALKAIEKALLRVEAEELAEAVSAYAVAVDGQDKQFIPNPATWFNAGRWEDDRSTWTRTESETNQPSLM